MFMVFVYPIGYTRQAYGGVRSQKRQPQIPLRSIFSGGITHQKTGKTNQTLSNVNAIFRSKRLIGLSTLKPKEVTPC
jgi:hypothetical protein